MEWKTIPSLPEYAVSEYGQVKRIAAGIRGGRIGKLMKPYVREDGYDMYILRHANKSHHKKAHQLVAEAFLGPRPFADAEVCHNDGTRTNNHFSNLRWDTRKANHADKRGHGTHLFGERLKAAKLTAEKVVAIRSRLAAGESQYAIAADFGVCQVQVSRINLRKQWSHV